MIELHNDINRLIEHTYKEIEKHFITEKDFDFYKLNLKNITLYIVYKRKIRLIDNKIATYELKENGIILEANSEFYYYNFEENYEKKEEVIKKFVERYYLG